MKPFAVPAVTAGVVLVASAALAADPLSIFQPQGVRAVSVTAADAEELHALPPLDAFGTMVGTRGIRVDSVGSREDAIAAAGYAARVPAKLPAQFATTARYRVSKRIQASFTFSAAKAAAWAHEHDVAPAPVPSGLDGATYTVTIAPVTLVTYGTAPQHGRDVPRSVFAAVLQAPVPVVTTSGATLATLARWFSEQPGMPPRLAAQVRAIGDPSQTLPIPVRFDRQTATDVEVDGVRGLAIGDQTGLGSAVVWTKGGTLHAVGGTMPQTDALALANSLQ